MPLPKRSPCHLDSDRDGLRVEVCAGRDVEILARKGPGPGRIVGRAVLDPRPGARALKVGEIEVDESSRRSGVGTRLYEAAVRVGCKAGLAVSSDEMRSPFAEAFWRKQLSKGRATCEGTGGQLYARPGPSGLPTPEMGKDGQPLWPCKRFVVRAPCEIGPGGLAGMRAPGRARRRA